MIVRRSCRFLYEHSPSTGFLRILKKLLTILRRLKFYRDSVHLPSILSVPALIFRGGGGEVQFSSTSFRDIIMLSLPFYLYFIRYLIISCVSLYFVSVYFIVLKLKRYGNNLLFSRFFFMCIFFFLLCNYI